jgi:hypothetical protein
MNKNVDTNDLYIASFYRGDTPLFESLMVLGEVGTYYSVRTGEN